jgi:hypothetical protein
LQRACERAASLAYPEPDCEELRQQAEKLSSIAIMLQRALTRYEQVRDTNSIFLRGERLLIGAALILVVIAIRFPWLGLAVIAAAAIWIVYRLSLSSRMASDAAARLRLLRLHGKAFTRETGNAS